MTDESRDPAPAARPVVVLLHAFGLSGRSWDGVVEALGDGFEPMALDLPGFGDEAGSDALTLEQTAEAVAGRIRARQPDRWLLVGHSMGGKVAAVLTAWAESGAHGLTAPDAVVLVDASPPSPEPMSDERRATMRGWAADGALSADEAARFVDANAPFPASPALREQAVADVQRTSPAAWLQWLDRGSREDWSDAVGVLRTPAAFVVSAGGDLGADAQPRLNGPHWPGAPVHQIDGASHFVVLERPREVAERIAAAWAQVAGPPVLPPAFARLIASDRVSARTRGILLGRLDPPADGPRAFTPPQRALLTALLARLVPQRGTDVDLVSRLDVELASGRGDGWRFADLPPDAEAWRAGLDTIAAVAGGFAALPGAEQDAWITRFAAGETGSDADGLLDAPRMALWLQDVRAEAVRVWLSHPAAQAWLRYDGFADGGDGERKQGWLAVGAGRREPWQRDWRTGAAVPRTASGAAAPQTREDA